MSELYPNAKIPASPILSLKTFGFSNRPPPSVTSAKSVRYVTSGRSAIALSLTELKTQKGDEILFPAFHCTSMIEPATWLGATPVFYRIDKNTKVNLNHIEQCITSKTKTLVVVHYFGFMQEMNSIRELCDRYNIALIEDCAHAFFGGTRKHPIGMHADYSIASPLKFFPIYDGGCLSSCKHPLTSVNTYRANIRFEIKSLINIIERSVKYDRLKALLPMLNFSMWLKNTTQNNTKNTESKDNKSNTIKKLTQTNLAPAAADGGFNFDPEWADKRMSIASRIVLSLTNKQRIIKSRLSNYSKWHEALKSSPGGKSLFDTLPDNTIPHVYPFLVDHPERLFPLLKKKGVPIIRFGEFLWDGVDETICPVSIELSRRVFQFPCHQELTIAELDWAISTVKETLAQEAANEVNVN